MTKPLYFLSEIEYREYMQRLLLACEIKNHHEIYILQFKQLKKYYKYFKPGLIFLNNASYLKRETIFKMNHAGYKFVLYHAESFATYNFYQKPSMFYDHKILDLMEYIFCVGKKQKDLLIKFYPRIEKKIFITGDIKYDLSNKKYDFFLKPQTELIRKKYKRKFILFPSNFSFGTWKYMNNDKLHYDHKMERYSKYKKKEYLLWKKGEIARNKHEYKYLFEYIKAIKLIANEFQNIDLIVRPHPADHPHFWEGIFEQKNIYVEYLYDIKSWIRTSELSLSYACSSVIENYFLHKNSLCYFPNFKKKYDKKFYFNVCLNSKSHKELLGHIKKIILNKKFIKKKLNKKFIYYDNKLSLNKKFKILNTIKVPNSKNSKFVEFLVNILESCKYLILKTNKIEYKKDKKKWTENHNIEYSKIVKNFNFKYKKNLRYKKIGPYITKIY